MINDIWYGIISHIFIYLAVCCGCILFLDGVGIFISILLTLYYICAIINLIIEWGEEEDSYVADDTDKFTDEDFMHCKIGEWVSRK